MHQISVNLLIEQGHRLDWKLQHLRSQLLRRVVEILLRVLRVY